MSRRKNDRMWGKENSGLAESWNEKKTQTLGLRAYGKKGGRYI